MDKPIRFIKALRDESIKRLPYVIAVFLLLILAQVYMNGQIAKRNSSDTKKLAARVLDLSSDNKTLIQQNKDLSAQNIDLSQKNATQLKCISDIFVDFINSGGSIGHADIENCQSVLNASGTGGTDGTTAAPASSQPATTPAKKSTPGSSSSKKPAGNPGKSQSPAPKATPPHPLICTLTLNLLGCH